MIGVTGPNASGKGEVCTYLERLGFVVHSLSDVIRDEAAVRELPPHREHLIRIGNELRAADGPGALARRILPKLGARAVVDSIRQPAEVAVLRELPQFVLLGVTAPVELRFQRALSRARPGDPQTLEAFVGREAEENSDNPAAQQLDATFALADHVVDNGDDLEALQATVQQLLSRLGVNAARMGG